MNNFQLKYHAFYASRIHDLQRYVRTLYGVLSAEEFDHNETVKLLARLRQATRHTIPENPNLSQYYLKGSLRKFRRYKQGMKRYRLLFCFSQIPAIIVYLYVNDKNHLRKQGGKNDPYVEFLNLLQAGVFSHNPMDQRMSDWIQSEHPS